MPRRGVARSAGSPIGALAGGVSSLAAGGVESIGSGASRVGVPSAALLGGGAGKGLCRWLKAQDAPRLLLVSANFRSPRQRGAWCPHASSTA